MAWVFDNDRPIYTQLVEQLQLQIVSGVYLPGGKLPEIKELAARAAVNPNTMQKALIELEKRGLIRSQSLNERVVSEDEQLIQHSRQELAKGQAAHFFVEMQGLGYTRDQAISFLQDMEGKGGEGYE